MLEIWLLDSVPTIKIFIDHEDSDLKKNKFNSLIES